MRFDPNDYVDVSDRITRFWTENPDGAIRTELASPASSFTEVVFRAEVYKHRDHAAPDAVGYAAEKPGNGANQTSWHENCETSAIGRALANMGYATSQKDRPSRQEMQKVNRAQPTPARTVNEAVGQPPLTDQGIDAITQQGNGREAAAAWFFAEIQKKGLTEDERRVLQRIAYGKESSKDLTERELRSLATTVRDKPVEVLRMKIAERMELDKPVAAGVS